MKYYTPKQRELMSMLRHNRLAKINILEGAVRSGKTWISLVLWAFWIASRPSSDLYLMAGKSISTLKRNCLLPLQEIIGADSFKFTIASKEGFLFGRRILLEGANDVRSESKIRGLTLGGAYCDEVTTFPEDFFDMLLTRLSIDGAKLFGTTNPDTPTHWLMKKYLLKTDIDLLRVKFLMEDNTFLPTDYIEEQKRLHTGVFYERFILGNWVIAEGAIYREFADNREKFVISPEKLHEKTGLRFDYVNVGVDFGGNCSAHTFVATGIHRNVLYALKSKRIPAAGVTPDTLYALLADFVQEIQEKYRFVDGIYCDSAEQTLISGIRSVLKRFSVYNARKNRIIDRIRATSALISSGRFFLLEGECDTLVTALCDAVYKPGTAVDERLDDGTSDIDTLDAFEYSWEMYIKKLIRVSGETVR